MWKSSAPVVVGVDGSDAAITAAKWAIDEAVSRDVPLRIVHVTHIEGMQPHRTTLSGSRSSTPSRRCVLRAPLWRQSESP
jgi:nucleotide-binding universal stress UspA family protein